MAEREFRTTPQWPIATTPLSGDELVEVWKGGKQYYVPFSELGGMPAAHSGTHKHGGDDEVGTLDNLAYEIPKLDADGLIDSRVSDATTTTKGKVQLATDGEENATKPPTSTDSRLKDARPPTAHATQHIAGTDVIADATVSNSGLMSAADKVKADATIPAYIPTADQKDALAGTAGTPGENNRYVTEASIGVDVAPLEDGVVPSTYLPSYVDDVLEFANQASFPSTGEASKIYVALDTNLTFRWSGSEYVEISKSLALGVTSATAYRGDRGKTAYDHSQSDHAPANADNTRTSINSASEKTTPVDGDAFPVLDSAASNALKKTTLANVKAVLKDYFDSFYSGGGGGGGSTGVDLLGIGEIGTGLSVGVVGQPVLTALNSTDVAFIDSYNGELRCYTFNGANWIQKGNGLSIASVGRTKGLAGLNSTDVALTDGDNGELRCYTFNGANWIQKGNGLSIASVGRTHALASLNSTDVAFIDSAEKELRCYTFDGTSWSQVGTGLAISGAGNSALATLNSTDVAFIDSVNDELRTYRFNGASWSQVGTGLSVSGTGIPALTSLNSTDVAFIDSVNEELRVYRFNGTAWSQVGTGLSIDASTPALTALNSTDVAFKGATNDELRTYSFLFGYDSASVNIVADYEVPEIATGKSIVIRRASAYDGNPVTITPPSGATFEGRASLSLYGQYSYVELERISSTVFAIKDLKDEYVWDSGTGAKVRKRWGQLSEKEIIGTTAATANADATVPHGLDFAKIVSANGMIKTAVAYTPMPFVGYGDFASAVSFYVGATLVYSLNSAALTEGYFSKPFIVEIRYKEW